jgi:hypothetical protein
MTSPIEQETEATHRRVFIRRSGFCEHAGIRFVADILRDLRDYTDAPGFVEVSCTVEKGHFHTSHVGETFFALEWLGTSSTTRKAAAPVTTQTFA